MTFINTIGIGQAIDDVNVMYKNQQGASSFVPNYARAFSHRPGVMSAWAELLKEIRDPMNYRRYLLVSLAAAQELKSSYCSLAFGGKLMRNFFSREELREILENRETGVLEENDKLTMRLARKVVRDSTSVTAKDISELRNSGCSDEEIFEVVAAAAARCFFAKIPDALGARPDSDYQQLDDALKELLVVGRPISEVSSYETG